MGGQDGWYAKQGLRYCDNGDGTVTDLNTGPAGQGRAYLDTGVFAFRYGDPVAGERPIDAQFWNATEYTGRTMGGNATVFGVNFADGRIKGYPLALPGRGERCMFVRYVRGGAGSGENDLVDNGTVSDRASGLMWMQVDSAALHARPCGDGAMDWPSARPRAGWAGPARWS
ncbi:MAG TPA: hypothetical protein VI279_06045 [Rhodocyclaceae bacterium]